MVQSGSRRSCSYELREFLQAKAARNLVFDVHAGGPDDGVYDGEFDDLLSARARARPAAPGAGRAHCGTVCSVAAIDEGAVIGLEEPADTAAGHAGRRWRG